jgi:hypothetical protein
MSFWGKLGKIALKVAPYAAMAIPGVGIPLGMAISGATSAASKKLSGGSWKDSLLSGGLSAGLAGVGGGALKGVGPSSGTLAKLGAGAAGKTSGTGFAGALGAGLRDIGVNAAGNAISGGGGDRAEQTTDRTGRGMGGFINNLNTPDLSLSLNAGRRDAISNQPFRSGYDIQSGTPEAPFTTTMPPISTTVSEPPVPSIIGRARRRVS